MKTVFRLPVLAGLIFCSTLPADEVLIPYEEFTLDNGLRVIVHEDRKAPIVAVHVWYHVGSKDEPEGRRGFAHLFEHLMFQGSENYDDDYFIPLERVGATQLNGTTFFDRTNYFQNVPTPALELALWMESDRMGHFTGAISQARLDEQREVVKNEKRQSDNQPYGRRFYRMLEGLFPEGHPYRWSPIGTEEDLDAATLDDVKEFFDTYYGPSNAVLVLAGDIDAQTARPLVEKYFGDIPGGDPTPRLKSWTPTRDAPVVEVIYDQVPQVRINRLWAVPGRDHPDEVALQLSSEILGSGRNSRLHRTLVHEERLATSVSASVFSLELASILIIDVMVAPGADPARVNEIMDREIGLYLERGPEAEELVRVRNRTDAQVIRGLERVGGFSGKAVALAEGSLYHNDPGFYRTWLRRLRAADEPTIHGTAVNWLGRGYYQIEIHPRPALGVAGGGADRSRLPDTVEMPELQFPEISTGELDNGIEVIFARRDTIPVVNISIQFDAGYAADAGGILGLSAFTSAMLDEGTQELDALEIAAAAESLGAEIFASDDLDTTRVTLSALSEHLDESVALFADVFRNPGFREADLERLRGQWLARIEQEQTQPFSIGLRLLPPLLYGTDHAYGIPLTGSGTLDSVRSITAEDLAGFHRTWFRPSNATLFVVGDTTLEEVLPVLNSHIGDWTDPDFPLPAKEIPETANANAGRIFLVHRPDSPQAIILAGLLAPPAGSDEELAIAASNDIIGGTFTSRINMNLREDKGWSYGARSSLVSSRGQQLWVVNAPVQIDKTSESVAEILTELTGYRTDAPATEDELDKIVNARTLALPGTYETAGAVLSSLTTSHRLGRPLDYPATLTGAYRALALDDIHQVTGDVLDTADLTWVIVGNLDAMRAEIEELDIADVTVLDADGRPVEQPM